MPSPLASRIEEIRSHFPRAASDAFGRRRAFFDNGAGSLVLVEAARAEQETRVNFSAEPDSLQEESMEAGRRIESGRQAVADLLNAPTRDAIVSGESTTSLLFDLSYALRRELTGKENILTTGYEHYANASPWHELEALGFVKEVRVAPVDGGGRLDLEKFGELIDSRTRLVSVSGASNLFGSISPLDEIRKRVRESESYFVVDAVHLTPHYPIDVQRLDCDFLVFSGYKLFSTYGSFLCGRPELLERLTPYKVKPAPRRIPMKWEHGNRDPAMFAAITAVVDYLGWLGSLAGAPPSPPADSGVRRSTAVHHGMRAIHEHEKSLAKVMLSRLAAFPAVRLYGPDDPNDVESRVPTFSFSIRDVEPNHVVDHLWRDGNVFVRQENFYSRAVEKLGVATVVRASLAHYNTEEEVGRFLEAMTKLLG